MINLTSIVVILFLIIASFIDYKVRAIPSVFLTSILIITVALNPGNISVGLIAGLLALLFMEFDFFGGIADIKVMTAIGFMLSFPLQLFAFVLILMVTGIIYKVFWKIKHPYDEECPFIPVITFSYLLTYIFII